MSPTNIRKISHPDFEISLYLSNFIKKANQQTVTYKKIENIWNKGRNIPGISPKDFRKITHPELDVSLYLSTFSKGVSQLTD